jgi:hypothetical protein
MPSVKKTRPTKSASDVFHDSNCFRDSLSNKEKEIIKKDPYYSIYYAENILQSRWPEAEPFMLTKEAILSHHYYIVEYGNNFFGNWEELEKAIVDFDLAEMATEYADSKERPFPEFEKVIIKNSNCAVRYALNVLRRRWPEAEPNIIRNGIKDRNYGNAIDYCQLIDGRWPELEQEIINDSNLCIRYVEAIKQRWPDFEKKMLSLKSPKKIIRYLRSVQKIGEELHNKIVMLSFATTDRKIKTSIDEYFSIIEYRKQKRRKFLDRVNNYLISHKGKSVDEVIEIVQKEEYQHIAKD